MRARIFKDLRMGRLPWVVVFRPPLTPWEYHAFYRWDSAVSFTFDILSGDCEKREFWLEQLR